MPILTNPTNERIELPTGHVIAGETYVQFAVLWRVDNNDYVNMLLRKGRLAIVELPVIEASETEEMLSFSTTLDISEEYQLVNEGEDDAGV